MAKKEFKKPQYKETPMYTQIDNLRVRTIRNWANKKDVEGNSWATVKTKIIEQGKKASVREMEAYYENQELAKQLNEIPQFRYTMATASILKGWAYILSTDVDNMRDAKWMVEFGATELDRLEGLIKNNKMSENANLFNKIMDIAQRGKEKRAKEVVQEVMAEDIVND